MRSESEEPGVWNGGSCISIEHVVGNAERIGGSKGHLLHNLGRILHADFPETPLLQGSRIAFQTRMSDRGEDLP